jgi:hypothetical protein
MEPIAVNSKDVTKEGITSIIIDAVSNDARVAYECGFFIFDYGRGMRLPHHFKRCRKI